MEYHACSDAITKVKHKRDDIVNNVTLVIKIVILTAVVSNSVIFILFDYSYFFDSLLVIIQLK
jgi:hypothetical protein